MKNLDLRLGDCLDLMRAMPDNSVDSVVTDPPYGLSFMGKAWDKGVPSCEVWKEALRVLKPGGHLLAFAGTRTQHRMACAIEDAGFEIRDMIAWVYGSGFPKSHNLKDEWDGWGSALKPALEPITVARKPLAKGNTIAANVLEYGTGAINVDGCRIEGEPWKAHRATGLGSVKFFTEGENPEIDKAPHNNGRWPANLIHDGSQEVLDLFPVTGASKSGGKAGWQDEYVGGKYRPIDRTGYDEPAGSAARFFYQAKASKRDRNEGLLEGTTSTHPTVKPTDLMRYLCRLVTPPNGIVLDPFMGSGSTGKAAVLEGFNFIGCELDAEYIEIAKARIGAVL